jgi:pimeloyl-ACP methyl ester carboxylesterase
MAKIAPPPLHDFLMEGLRTAWAFLEFQSHLGTPDGQRPLKKVPIVVVPGFFAANITTLALRRYFENAGHPTYTPDILVNHGGRSIIRATHDVIEMAADKHGKKPVAVGHSLGGAVCLFTAYEDAALEHVYTLGSPLRTAMGQGGANGLLALAHSGLSLFDEWSSVAHELQAYMHAGPPPVGLTTIRAKRDGVVAWKAAGHPWRRTSNGVEGGHCGLVASKAVAKKIVRSAARPSSPHASAKFDLRTA